MEQQVPEHGKAKAKLASDATAVLPVEAHRGRDGDHFDPGDVRGVCAIPLQSCQVCNAMPSGGEARGQAAVPPFGTADGVRIETVEDEADAHLRPREGLQTARSS